MNTKQKSKTSKTLIKFSDVIKWLKTNADDNYYIGYNVNVSHILT